MNLFFSKKKTKTKTKTKQNKNKKKKKKKKHKFDRKAAFHQISFLGPEHCSLHRKIYLNFIIKFPVFLSIKHIKPVDQQHYIKKGSIAVRNGKIY